jgi:type II secretory pathway component PulK
MRSERGSAMILVMTLLAILTAMIFANGRVIHQLSQELHRLDRQHQHRLHEQNSRPQGNTDGR